MYGIDLRLSQGSDLEDYKLLTATDIDFTVEKVTSSAEDSPTSGTAYAKYIVGSTLGKYWALNGAAVGDIVRWDDDWDQYIILVDKTLITKAEGAPPASPVNGVLYHYDAETSALTGAWALAGLGDNDYIAYNSTSEEWEIVYDVSELATTTIENTDPVSESDFFYVDNASTIHDCFYVVTYPANSIIMFIDYDLNNNLINRYKLMCDPETESTSASYIVRNKATDKYLGYYHTTTEWKEIGGGSEEEVNLEFDFSLSGGSFVYDGIYATVDLAAGVAQGDIVYLKSDGTYGKAFADNVVDGSYEIVTNSTDTMPGFALALEAVGDGDEKILLHGTAHKASWDSLTIGSFVYVSTETAGAIMIAAPDGENLIYNGSDELMVDENGDPIGTGHIQQIIGRVIGTGTIYFNFDNTFIELERMESGV